MMNYKLYVVDTNTGDIIDSSNPNEVFWKRMAFKHSRHSKKNKGFYREKESFSTYLSHSVIAFYNSLLCRNHHSTNSDNPLQ